MTEGKNRTSYIRVSVPSNHVGYIPGVGQLPAKYILDDNHSFACIHRGLGDVRLEVLDLNFLAHATILHLVTNVTWAGVSFISH